MPGEARPQRAVQIGEKPDDERVCHVLAHRDHHDGMADFCDGFPNPSYTGRGWFDDRDFGPETSCDESGDKGLGAGDA